MSTLSITADKRRRAVACLALCLALGMSGCQFHTGDTPELLDTIQIVPGTAVATVDDVYQLQTMEASVIPETTELSFVISGNLAEAYYDVGDVVHKGDALMNLDDSALADKIAELEEQIESTRQENDRTNRKVEIKIEIAQLQLTQLEKELSSIPEDEEPPVESKPEESQPTENEPAVSEPEENESNNTSSEEPPQESSEDENTSQSETQLPDESVMPTSMRAVQADTTSSLENEQKRNDLSYDILLKKLEIENYELILSQNKESQDAALAIKQNLLEEYREEQKEYTLYAPSDGTVLWMCPAADPLQKASPSVGAEQTVLLFADHTKLQLQSTRISPSVLLSYERIYAIIDGKEYDVAPLENDVKEDSVRAMEGKTLKTNYQILDDHVTAKAGTAVLCFQYNVAENVLTVPIGCTFHDTDYFVYRMNGNEREKVYVEIGTQGAVRVEIRSGLQEGDVVYAKP